MRFRAAIIRAPYESGFVVLFVCKREAAYGRDIKVY